MYLGAAAVDATDEKTHGDSIYALFAVLVIKVDIGEAGGQDRGIVTIGQIVTGSLFQYKSGHDGRVLKLDIVQSCGQHQRQADGTSARFDDTGFGNIDSGWRRSFVYNIELELTVIGAQDIACGKRSLHKS